MFAACLRLSACTGPLPAHLLKQILYEETEERLHSLGRISDAEGSLVRTFFSPAHIRAASQVPLAHILQKSCKLRLAAAAKRASSCICS